MIGLRARVRIGPRASNGMFVVFLADIHEYGRADVSR